MDIPSSRRVRAPTQRTSKSTRRAPSELSTPPRRRKSNKKVRNSRATQEPEEIFYSLGTPAILEEEQRPGGLYYKFNWAADPRTGEEYEPTWGKAEDATNAAVGEWEQLKAERNRLKNTAPSQPNRADIEESDESQEIRPAKRRRTKSGKEDILHEGRAVKRPRRNSTAESATLQSKAQPPRSAQNPPEIPDSCPLVDPDKEEVRVELPPLEDFDREVYAVAQASQPSQEIPETQDTRESQSTQGILSVRTPNQQRSLFIWDEEVVPDSVETGASYKLSSIGTKHSGSAKSSNGILSQHLTSSSELISTRSGILRVESSFVDSSLAEAQSALADHSYQNSFNHSNHSRSSNQYRGAESSIKNTTNSGSRGDSRSSHASAVTASINSTAVPSVPLFNSSNSHEPIAHNTTGSQPQQSEQFLTQVVRHPDPQVLSSPSVFADLQQGSRDADTTRSVRPVSNQSSTPATLSQASSQQQSFPSKKTSPSLIRGEVQSASSRIRLPSQPTSLSPASRSATSRSVAQSARIPGFSSEDQIESIETFQPVRQSPQSTQSKSSQSRASQSSHLPSPPTEDPVPFTAEDITLSSAQPVRQPTPLSSDPVIGSSPARPASSLSMESFSGSPPNEGFSTAQSIKLKLAQTRADAARKQAREQLAKEKFGLPPSGPSTSPQVPIVTDQSIAAVEPLVPVLAAASVTPSVLSQIPIEEAKIQDPIRPEDHIAPLPMVARVREHARIAVRGPRRKDLVRQFIDGHASSLDPSQLADIDAMIQELRDLCDCELVFEEDDPASQAMWEKSVVAKRAENVSTKCMFLIELLKEMTTCDKHVLILSRPGKMVTILAFILEHHGLAYSLGGATTKGEDIQGSLRITLHPTNMDLGSMEPASLIIAYDSTSWRSEVLITARAQSHNGNAPVISLVIRNSIEHVERTLNHDGLDPLQQKIRLVKGVQSLYKQGMEPCELDLRSAAVVEYFSARVGSIDKWPFEALGEILSDSESESSLQGDELDGEQQTEGTPPLQPSMKRQLSPEMDITESPKRQRLTPVPDVAATPFESSSVGLTSSGPPNSSYVSAANKLGDVTQDYNPRQGSQELLDLKEQFRDLEAKHGRLRSHYNTIEKRAAGYEKHIEESALQLRKIIKDGGSFKDAHEDALDKLAKERKKKEDKIAEIATLKADLAATRQLLSASMTSGIADTSQIQEENFKLRSTVKRLEKKVETLTDRIGYLNTGYQDVSLQTRQLQAELDAMKEQNEDLQEKADENAIRVHEIQPNKEVDDLMRKNKSLEARLADMERMYERKDEELKALSNGRRGTRGTTPLVPRSPKPLIGGIMSTGVMSPASAGRRILQQSVASGSRGSSPAPGEMKTFGGELPSLSDKNPRWPRD